MRFRCVVIDDEQPSLDMMASLINAVPGLELVAMTTNPLEGIKLLQKLQPEIVFLDIDMPGLNGLEIARLVRAETRIVFCTAYPQFALEGHEAEALDFLLKPVPLNRFMRTVDRIFRQKGHVKSPDNDYIFVRTDHNSKFEKVDLDELEYIEAKGNYVGLYFTGKRHLLTHASMDMMERKLLCDDFMRIHRSYIISLSKIQLIDHGRIILGSNRKEISVGQNYREDFREKIRLRMLNGK